MEVGLAMVAALKGATLAVEGRLVAAVAWPTVAVQSVVAQLEVEKQEEATMAAAGLEVGALAVEVTVVVAPVEAAMAGWREAAVAAVAR